MEVANAESNGGIYYPYVVKAGDSDYARVYLTPKEQREILKDFENEKRIKLSTFLDENGNEQISFEILEPVRKGRSLYGMSVTSISDLLKDFDLRKRVAACLVRAFSVCDLREIKSGTEVTVDVLESDDELILLMDQLGITETDWNSLQNQKHRVIGNRYVRVHFFGSMAKTFADALYGRTSIIRSRTLEHLAGIFKDQMTRQKLEDLFVHEGVPTGLLIGIEGSKSDLIREVFLTLASTGEVADKELLFHLIEEFVHPLMFDGDEQLAQAKQIQISKLLRYDNLSVIGGRMREYTDQDKETITKFDQNLNETDPNLYKTLNETLNQMFGFDYMSKHVVGSQESKEAKPETKLSDKQKEVPTPMPTFHIHNVISNEVNNAPQMEMRVDSAATSADVHEDVNKFPYPIPAGTTWNNVVITFLDDRRVKMSVSGKEHTADYVELGLTGHGNPPTPSVLWSFLKVLGQLNGEIEIKDPEAKDQYKKQKQQLSQFLKKYFSLDTDPFHPYKNEKSYKTKFTVFCDVNVPASTSDNKQDIEESLDDEIASELARQAPSVIEDIPIAE